jgi:phosphatidylglycerophosphate synthase
MDRRPLKTRSQAWPEKLALSLVRAGLKPNQVSIASIGFSALAAADLWQQGKSWLLLFAAAACIQLRLVCNLLDGLMAVEGGLKSKTGDLFNEIPDRIADVLIMAGAGYGCGHAALGWLAAVLSVSTAYLRLLGGALDVPQDFGGPMAKQQRMAVLTFASLLAGASVLAKHPLPLIHVALWIIVAGAAATCIRRTLRLRAKLLNR